MKDWIPLALQLNELSSISREATLAYLTKLFMQAAFLDTESVPDHCPFTFSLCVLSKVFFSLLAEFQDHPHWSLIG